MASSIGVIRVDPRGESFDVSMTTNGTARPRAFTSEDGDTLHTFPQTITTETAYWFTRPTSVVVSCKRSGTELAWSTGTTRAFQIDHGTAVRVTPIGDPSAEALIEAVSLSDAGLEADIPDAAVDGRLYFTTDSGLLFRDNGLAWVQFPATSMSVAAHEADTTDVHGIADTADVVVRVFHEADADFARPSTPNTVLWIGTVTPNNAEATDLFVNTT